MIVEFRERDEDYEPVWDAVSIRGCDFRPHFDGCLYNVSTTIFPLAARRETERRFLGAASEMIAWVLAERARFENGDRFQIVVGWPREVRPVDRQVVKACGTFEDLRRLADEPAGIRTCEGWQDGVFDRRSAKRRRTLSRK